MSLCGATPCSRRFIWWLLLHTLVTLIFVSPHMKIEADVSGATCEETDEQVTMDAIFQRSYNKDVLPARGGVLVRVELHVQDISDVSELTADFEVDVFFSSIWLDPSLSFVSLAPCQRNLTLDLRYLGRIWTPNIAIVNSKSAVIHRSPAENAMLILYQNGTVWLNYRMRIRGPCDIELRNYPFDYQTCFLLVESYSYHQQKVMLQWLEHRPVTFIRPGKLPDFTLSDHKTERSSMQYPNGMWDQLRFSMTFKRRFGFLVLQAYIPTYMTIFVAWISFWMDPKQISARATLGISSFLAMTLQFGNILRNQPPVSYIKAMDVWMLGGMVFLFASLAELAVISYMQRSLVTVCQDGSPVLTNVRKATPYHADSPLPFRAKSKKLNSLRFLNGFSSHTEAPSTRMVTRQHLSAQEVDRWCMVAFPVTFFLFNIFYWTYYSTGLASLPE